MDPRLLQMFLGGRLGGLGELGGLFDDDDMHVIEIDLNNMKDSFSQHFGRKEAFPGAKKLKSELDAEVTPSMVRELANMTSNYESAQAELTEIGSKLVVVRQDLDLQETKYLQLDAKFESQSEALDSSIEELGHFKRYSAANEAIIEKLRGQLDKQKQKAKQANIKLEAVRKVTNEAGQPGKRLEKINGIVTSEKKKKQSQKKNTKKKS